MGLLEGDAARAGGPLLSEPLSSPQLRSHAHITARPSDIENETHLCNMADFNDKKDSRSDDE